MQWSSCRSRAPGSRVPCGSNSSWPSGEQLLLTMAHGLRYTLQPGRFHSMYIPQHSKSKDFENGFPQRGDPALRKNPSNKSGLWACIPPKGRSSRHNFRKFAIQPFGNRMGPRSDTELQCISFSPKHCAFA